MQAIIMSAYRDFDYLIKLLELYSKKFNCYVHIDKRAGFADSKHIEILNQMENVTAISEYKIKWGSYCHLLALHKLLIIALKDSSNTRFHFISDADLPIRSYSDFETFFKDNDNNYIEVTDITQMPVIQKRYKIFHLQHVFDRKSNNKCIIIMDKIIRNLQYLLHVKRKTKYSYKGLVWGSITREAAMICSAYLKDSRIRNLKYCENSEEFWLSNAILESDLKETVKTNSLRFAIWDAQNVSGPRELDISDLELIEKSDAFFARKILSSSNELYKRLVDRFLCIK